MFSYIQTILESYYRNTSTVALYNNYSTLLYSCTVQYLIIQLYCIVLYCTVCGCYKGTGSTIYLYTVQYSMLYDFSLYPHQ